MFKRKKKPKKKDPEGGWDIPLQFIHRMNRVLDAQDKPAVVSLSCYPGMWETHAWNLLLMLEAKHGFDPLTTHECRPDCYMCSGDLGRDMMKDLLIRAIVGDA